MKEKLLKEQKEHSTQKESSTKKKKKNRKKKSTQQTQESPEEDFAEEDFQWLQRNSSKFQANQPKTLPAKKPIIAQPITNTIQNGKPKKEKPTSPTTPWVQCPICNEGFPDELLLSDHLDLIHSPSPPTTKKETKSKTSQTPSPVKSDQQQPNTQSNALQQDNRNSTQQKNPIQNNHNTTFFQNAQKGSTKQKAGPSTKLQITNFDPIRDNSAESATKNNISSSNSHSTSNAKLQGLSLQSIFSSNQVAKFSSDDLSDLIPENLLSPSQLITDNFTSDDVMKMTSDDSFLPQGSTKTNSVFPNSNSQAEFSVFPTSLFSAESHWEANENIFKTNPSPQKHWGPAQLQGEKIDPVFGKVQEKTLHSKKLPGIHNTTAWGKEPTLFSENPNNGSLSGGTKSSLETHTNSSPWTPLSHGGSLFAAFDQNPLASHNASLWSSPDKPKTPQRSNNK